MSDPVIDSDVLCILCSEFVEQGLNVFMRRENRNGPSVVACDVCLTIVGEK